MSDNLGDSNKTSENLAMGRFFRQVQTALSRIRQMVKKPVFRRGSHSVSLSVPLRSIKFLDPYAFAVPLCTQLSRRCRSVPSPDQ